MVSNKVDPLSDDRGSAPLIRGATSIGRSLLLFWFSLRSPLQPNRRPKINDPGRLLGREGARLPLILVPR
jgi:hypothetical protein